MPFIFVKPAHSDRDYFVRTDAIDAIYQSVDYPYAKTTISMNNGWVFDVKEKPYTIVQRVHDAERQVKDAEKQVNI